ncbi:hypothetical protein RAS12_30165 (plasmid) [Achromobacter seleniivolatilans]|uniref:Uncharacterized protein n=1 Tax=Achromobacter seleniivolatilans TaxID=3047478 RepID=A0ABY9MBC3_9BURK|nr:hypothetical protein [Achromobacter sp. R39]WMD23899.1 hypothetical protein RAS12_30165 [Achromobacter sp. R39]
MRKLCINTDRAPSAEGARVPPDSELWFLDPGPANEAIHERFPGGAAARAKLASSITGGLSAQFYFSIGEIVKKAGSTSSSLKFTGYEFREATKGSRKGRWIIPVPGTKRTVTVSSDEIAAFEAVQPAASAASRP